MRHTHLSNTHDRPRKLTQAQLQARIDYGAPLPLQPRRPLKRLAGHPVYRGRVPVITGEALRANPELHEAYFFWAVEQINRWMKDGTVGLLAISGTWIAHRRK
jgi:hypothetical protein